MTERGDDASPALRGLAASFTFAVVCTAIALGFGRWEWLLAWVVFGAALGGYVVLTRRAHATLRRVVVDGWQGEIARPKMLLGRPESVYALAEAFLAVRRRDTISAESALARVARDDLGAWEQRVFDAVRALARLEESDQKRAAELAPLALPTGAPAVDRALAVAMVRAAWKDDLRLRAIARALEGVGDHVRDVWLAAEARLGRAPEGAGDAHVAAVAAGEIGDDELRERLLVARAESRGYR